MQPRRRFYIFNLIRRAFVRLFSISPFPPSTYIPKERITGLDSRRELRALVARGRGRPPEVRSVPLVLRAPLYPKEKKQVEWAVLLRIVLQTE